MVQNDGPSPYLGDPLMKDMTKWEYNAMTVERANEVRSPGDPDFREYILDRLNVAGLEGWEVCAYCLGFLIVKRPLIEP